MNDLEWIKGYTQGYQNGLREAINLLKQAQQPQYHCRFLNKKN